MITYAIEQEEKKAVPSPERSFHSPRYRPTENWENSEVLDEKTQDFNSDDVIKRELPMLFDNADSVMDILKNAAGSHFVMPVWFTAEPPECFESLDKTKFWATAMTLGLGGNEPLEAHVLLEAKGVTTDQSRVRDVKRAKRVLVYPARERWAEDPRVVRDEYVMREILLPQNRYQLTLYSLPQMNAVTEKMDVSLLQAFFRRINEVLSEDQVLLYAGLTEGTENSINKDQLRPVFKKLFPGKGIRLFCGTNQKAELMRRDFEKFCDDEIKRRLMLSQARVLLKTMLARECAPIEITLLEQPMLAEALFVMIHQSGISDLITFSPEVTEQYDLGSELIEQCVYNDPALYLLDPEIHDQRGRMSVSLK